MCFLEKLLIDRFFASLKNTTMETSKLFFKHPILKLLIFGCSFYPGASGLLSFLSHFCVKLDRHCLHSKVLKVVFQKLLICLWFSLFFMKLTCFCETHFFLYYVTFFSVSSKTVTIFMSKNISFSSVLVKKWGFNGAKTFYREKKKILKWVRSKILRTYYYISHSFLPILKHIRTHYVYAPQFLKSTRTG